MQICFLWKQNRFQTKDGSQYLSASTLRCVTVWADLDAFTAWVEMMSVDVIILFPAAFTVKLYWN